MQVLWHLPAASLQTPLIPRTAVLVPPPTPTLLLPPLPPPQPTPLTHPSDGAHRLLLDVGHTTTAGVSSLGGSVTLVNGAQRVLIPVLHRLVLPERIPPPDLKPEPLGRQSLLETLHVPAFAEEVARAQRANEREVLGALRQLLAVDVDQTYLASTQHTMDKTLESVQAALRVSLPSVMEHALADAAEREAAQEQVQSNYLNYLNPNPNPNPTQPQPQPQLTREDPRDLITLHVVELGLEVLLDHGHHAVVLVGRFPWGLVETGTSGCRKCA